MEMAKKYSCINLVILIIQIVVSFLESNLAIHVKNHLNMQTFDLVILLLAVYPKKWSEFEQKLCKRQLKSTLFIMINNENSINITGH